MTAQAGVRRKAHFLGTKIRSLRKRHNLTLEDLSVRCIQIDAEGAPSVSYLSMIENGKRVPSERLVSIVAEIFQKDVDWFFDEALEEEAIDTAPDAAVAGMPLAEVSGPLAEYVARWRQDETLSSHPELTLITEGDNVRITAHLAPLGKGGRRDGPILVFLEDSSHMNERVQQSKLAALGRLSASIAHEIRNPVGAMSHAAQLLAESSGLNDEE